MDKLYREKRYNEIIELFEKQLSDYSAERSFSESAIGYFRQAIPFDQLTCVVAALLAQVRLTIFHSILAR